MQRFKIICLWLVLMVGWSVGVIAGETGEATDNKEAEPKENPFRVNPSVEGYQLLSVSDVDIEATYLEETFGERHGAIVFFHDQGAQLESQGVITPLRHQMINYGWSTLTLALDYPFEPNILLAGESDTEQAVENEDAITEDVSLLPISNQQRIDAATAFLQAKGIKRIIFLGHGTGGHLAIEILSEIATPISALILVGMPELSLLLENAFNPMKQPILEIYGDNDLKGVAEAVKRRKTMMKRSESEQYSEREIIGADHVFYGLQPVLVKVIRGWLNTTFVEPDKTK